MYLRLLSNAVNKILDKILFRRRFKQIRNADFCDRTLVENISSMTSFGVPELQPLQFVFKTRTLPKKISKFGIHILVALAAFFKSEISNI